MIVFLHGVPETAVIWRKVRDAIDRESIALELPGFGCPKPNDFEPTKDAYANWVADRLAELGEPVHLVGHDWGAGLTYRLATSRPELLASWAADVGNLAHPDYEWHDFAQIWQTEGDGEAFFDAQIAQPVEERAATYELLGLAPEDALEMAAGIDETMAACILGLYRSTVPNAHADWGPWQPVDRPGLVLHPEHDLFSDATLAAEVATALGADFRALPDAGHFWPYQSPQAAADLLVSFWDRAA